MSRPRGKSRRKDDSTKPTSRSIDVTPIEVATPPLWRQLMKEPIALGLALMVFFRPWRDGMTYPSFNVYFLWVVILLTALWGARLLFRGEPIRFGQPIGLFALFIGIALLTGFGTIQVDATYRTLLSWSGYCYLFILCTNGLRTRLAIGIVLAAFIITAFTNAVWALIHFQFMLPLMREEVLNNPDVLYQFFGTRELTPEIRFRLEMNRAFGTLLFPNALAAFMILTIPCLVGECFPTYAAWRSFGTRNNDASGAKEGRKKTRRQKVGAAVAGFSAWFITIVTAAYVHPFMLQILARESDWNAHPVQQIIFMGVVPVCVAGACTIITWRYGLRTLRLTLQTILLPLALIIQSLALLATYSRGGVLAIGVAGIVGLALMAIASGKLRPRRWARRTAAVAAILIVVIFAASVSTSWAQEEDAQATKVSEQAEPKTKKTAKKEPVPQNRNVRIKGTRLGIADMLSTSTLGLRLTYWKVGLRMARENLWTGVGLGNFGTAYPQHLYVGAGEVQTAHNDYLQMLCETGIFGCLAFCAFWGYFCVWGARRILREKVVETRWLLCGMYTAVLAFLLHSLVDFNFSNPTLASLVFFLAGVFYSRCAIMDRLPAPSTQKSRLAHQAIAFPLLVSVALLSGAAVRVYAIDFALTEGGVWNSIKNVGNTMKMRHRFDVSTFFLKEIQRKPIDPRNPPYRRISEASLLFPRIEMLETFGLIRVPEANALRPLAEGEELPANAVVFIRDAERARQAAVEMTEIWLERLARTDEIYPYIPEVTMTLFNGYDLLQSQEKDDKKRISYIRQCLKWSTKGVERNPSQAWYHDWLGKSLWLLAREERGAKALDLYRDGIAEYKRSTELYPSSDKILRQYRWALRKLGVAFIKAGLKEEGQRYMREGRQAMAQLRDLEAQIKAAHRAQVRKARGVAKTYRKDG